MTQKSQRKKVLIITYYWPPAGGPGVQRVLKFAKYLPEFGWEPIILTVKDGEYPAIDESLVTDIPPEIKVYKTRSLAPFQLYKFLSGKRKNYKIDSYVLMNEKKGVLRKMMSWIRFNIVLPDARVGWVPFAIRQGLKILNNEDIDVIFSTSPPHSLQLTAMQLAKKTRTPWVADFRDPWGSIHYYQNARRMGITKKIDAYLEKKVLNSANSVVTISKHISRQLSNLSGRENISVIYNGYDSIDFKDIKPFAPSEKIIITYAGFLSDSQIPYLLLDVLLTKKNEKFKDIELHIFGNASARFEKYIQEKNLGQNIKSHGYVNHSVLIHHLSQSDALLMVVNNVPDNKGILTGKLFDYMGAHRPIIALGPKDGEVEQIISHSKSGWYIEYNDEKGMERCLTELTEGRYQFDFNIEGYDRRIQAQQLSGILDDAFLSVKTNT